MGPGCPPLSQLRPWFELSSAYSDDDWKEEEEDDVDDVDDEPSNEEKTEEVVAEEDGIDEDYQNYDQYES